MTPAASHRHPPSLAALRPEAANRKTVWDVLLSKQSQAGGRGSRGEARQFPISSDVAHAIVRDGISGEVLAPLGELLELGPTQLAPVIGVDRATARRYAQNDQMLPRHSAETVLRLAELEMLALDVFASEAAAHGWLKQPHALLGESPIDAAATSYGTQRVREILFAIKHGGPV